MWNTRTLKKRGPLALMLALLAALSSSAVAHAAAGTVKVVDNGSYKEVKYTGTADANVVTFGGSAAGQSVTIVEAGIADPGGTADPGNDCDLTAADTLTCRDAELLREEGPASADLGAGNDVTTGTGTQSWRVNGSTGEDRLTGSDQGEDYLHGGPDNDTIDARGDSGIAYAYEYIEGDEGNDVLRGGPGADGLHGGAGNDDLDAGAGDDSAYGGEGLDTVRGGSGSDEIDTGAGDGELAEGGDGSDWLECVGDANEVYDGGAGFDELACDGGVAQGGSFEPDDYLIDLSGGVVRRTNHVQTLATARSIEDAYTDDGDDVLIGTAGANHLWAGAGDDVVDGRAGGDLLWGYGGKDTLVSDDGTPDRLDAGADADTCRSDQADERLECEALTLAPQLRQPGPSPAALDQTGPECALARLSGSRAKGRITFEASCDEAGTIAAEAVGRLRRLPRGALASRVGDLTLASRTVEVAAGARVRVTLRLSRAFRRALPKRSRVRVVVRATDALGNQRALSRAVRLR